jgi:hypothetical protein
MEKTKETPASYHRGGSIADDINTFVKMEKENEKMKNKNTSVPSSSLQQSPITARFPITQFLQQNKNSGR